jgi:hypothetical protein
MDEPIITFGSESLIIEMNPETIPEPTVEVPIPAPTPEPVRPKTWCILS